MPVQGKKPTIPHSADPRQGQSAPALPDQEEFHPHCAAGKSTQRMRVVLEEVMREEFDQFIGGR